MVAGDLCKRRFTFFFAQSLRGVTHIVLLANPM
jgi:hypothetical protein